MLGALTLIIIRYHIELVSLSEDEVAFNPVETGLSIVVTPTPEATPSSQTTPISPPEEVNTQPSQNSYINEALPSQTPSGQAAPSVEATDKPKSSLPEGFVYLSEALPDAKFDVRYATAHNFTGKVVDGYLSDNISATGKAAEALQKVSADVQKKGYGLLIYDAYRPKRAVDFFIQWSNQPEDNLTKDEFYPDFAKQDLFKLGYLAKRSAHSKGSTIDLTLFYLKTGEVVDMGSNYDFLGPISNHGTTLITEEQTRNRNILKEAMTAAGFKALRTEWWHYQLINEPFPDTFFDFVIGD